MKCQFIWASHECNLDIEQGTDLETLKCLALSLTPNFDAEEINLETLLFLDYCGREIDTDSDLEHIILENKPISPSSDTSSDNSDWYFTVWCTNKIQLTSPTCTRTMLQEQYIIQPTYRLIDTDFLFCSYCQQYVDSSLIVAETRSLTRFCCRYEEAVTVGLCQSLTSISGYHEHSQSNLHPLTINAHRVLFERALSTQSCYPQIIIQQRKRFDARLVSGSSTALSYENIQWQEQARAVIDYQALRLYAVEELVAEPTMAKDVAFMHGLLRWFKCDFFKWCNKPGCENVYCSAVPDVNPSNMESVGTERAYTTEATDGGAQMTEVYRCSVCRELTRFPRYNNPAMLLSTRRGRCGEFANTFALLCRSLGLDTRYVLDWTDHVWVEVWLPSLGRFVHADSCERALDSSLMYEAGWNKKLHTIISFGRYGINDVISRYSRKSDEIYMRRHEQLELPEISVRQSISQHDSSVYQAYVTRTVASRQSDEQSQIPEGIWDSDSVHFDTLELDSIGFKRLAAIELPVDVVDIRRRKECRDLMGMTFLRPKDVKLEEMRGRISGDIAWRVARGELGTCTTNDIID